MALDQVKIEADNEIDIGLKAIETIANEAAAEINRSLREVDASEISFYVTGQGEIILHYFRAKIGQLMSKSVEILGKSNLPKDVIAQHCLFIVKRWENILESTNIIDHEKKEAKHQMPNLENALIGFRILCADMIETALNNQRPSNVVRPNFESKPSIISEHFSMQKAAVG